MKPRTHFQPFDEDVLSSYIEDELAPHEVARLEAALADHPDVLLRLELLRRDRAGLRGLPEPAVPHDLVTQLEGVLARPMLVDARPGSYRRRYHRRARRRRILLGGLAASLLVISGATLLVVEPWSGGMQPTTPGDELAMADDRMEPRLADTDRSQGPAEDDAWPPEDAIVHHHPTWTATATPEPTVTVTSAEADHAGDDEPEALPFALVVRAADADRTEERLASHLSAIGHGVALVRNFSFDDARRIETELLARRRSRPAAGSPVPTTAGVDASKPEPRWSGADVDEDIRRILQQMGDRDGSRRSRPARASRLVGAPRWAASPRTQLVFSGQGASHTVTVPLAELPALLERLRGPEVVETALCWLPQQVSDPSEIAWDEPAPLPDDRSVWLRDRARIRAYIEALRAESPDATVLLPVVIRASR